MNSLFSETQIQAQAVLFCHSDLKVWIYKTQRGNYHNVCVWIKVRILSLNYIFAKTFMMTVNSNIFINTQRGKVDSYGSFCNTIWILSVLEGEKKGNYRIPKILPLLIYDLFPSSLLNSKQFKCNNFTFCMKPWEKFAHSCS